MNKNLFLKEMKRNTPSLLLWSAVICLLIFFTMSFYRTFAGNKSQVTGMLNLIPKELLQIKGFTDINSLFSILGFYAANNTIYMMLLGSIYSIVLSSNILLKEEYHKTAEYLFSRPLTRSEIFNTKAAVFVLNVFLLNLITGMIGLLAIYLFKTDEFNMHPYLILSAYTLLLNLLFGAIGLIISTLVRRSKSITTFSIALVMVFYFVFTISKITKSAENIGYLSPFRYVRSDVMSDTYSLDFPHLLYFLGISLVLIFLAWFFFNRKDIYT